MFTLVMKSVSLIKPDPNQPRKEFDKDALQKLGESMQTHGQLQPILVRADDTLIAGERRYRAALLVGIKELSAIITDRAMSDSEIRQIQLAENVHRTDLTAYEKYLAYSELMCMNTGWQQKDLAHAMRVSEKTVTFYLSPSRCTPEWQKALEAGKVTIADCYDASRLTASEQAERLALKLSGASREAIEQTTKRKRTAPKKTEKLSRVRCPLPNGAVVTVAGSDLDLQTLIEHLTLAKEAAVRAHKDSLGIETAQKFWADKAKAGT